jgi:hypothetical protein
MQESEGRTHRPRRRPEYPAKSRRTMGVPRMGLSPLLRSLLLLSLLTQVVLFKGRSRLWVNRRIINLVTTQSRRCASP